MTRREHGVRRHEHHVIDAHRLRKAQFERLATRLERTRAAGHALGHTLEQRQQQRGQCVAPATEAERALEQLPRRAEPRLAEQVAKGRRLGATHHGRPDVERFAQFGQHERYHLDATIARAASDRGAKRARGRLDRALDTRVDRRQQKVRAERAAAVEHVNAGAREAERGRVPQHERR